MVEVATSASAWARIVVMRGAEAAQHFLFEENVPARLSVGSDPAADLVFPHADVAPRHLDVVWDGENLWLEDGLRLGRTLVNGKRLNEWEPVLGQAVVTLGQARLLIQAIGPRPRSSSPNYEALEAASLADPPWDPENRRSNTGRITLPPELMKP